MLNVRLFVVTLTLAFNMSAQSGGNANTEKRLTPAENDTIVQGWPAGDVLSALIRVGFANHLPLGIVLEGDSLCKSRVPGSSEGISIGSLMDQIQKQDSFYAAEIRDHVLYVHPKLTSSSTQNALDLRIPHFTSKSTNAQQLGIGLWMHIRSVLVPQETSMFAGSLQSNEETLPPVDLPAASVLEILNRVASSGQGTVWIMHQVPAGWQSDPQTKPFEIFSYSGNKEPAELIRCQEAK